MSDINIGAISEALNNKVDLNQMNTNTQGLSYASGWGMPSGNALSLTLGASGTTYTAPANGWLRLGKTGCAAGNYAVIWCSGIETAQNIYSGGGTSLSMFIPMKKGSEARIHYGFNNTSGITFVFIYAEGAN